MIATSDISYGDLEKLGWPDSLINDYQALKQDLVPLRGTDATPESVLSANLNGFYVNTNTSELWFNPIPGALTGWIQLI